MAWLQIRQRTSVGSLLKMGKVVRVDILDGLELQRFGRFTVDGDLLMGLNRVCLEVGVLQPDAILGLVSCFS
jgi:hypothetical protein